MIRLPGLEDLDPEQRRVVEAPVEDRLVVTAGPGTGKTAVACTRIAWLVRQGVPASSILMFSFTRTAVAELRARIERAADAAPDVRGVRIVTLDSEAWRVRYGLSEDEVERFGGFDENIEAFEQLLASQRDEVLDYLERFRHVIVDEAQDLTEARAKLVLTFLARLDRSCGCTVFGDPAQAIYGFAATDGRRTGGPRNLLQMLDHERARLRHASLMRNHRTGAEQVSRVFEAARRMVVSQPSGAPRHQAVLDAIWSLTPEASPELLDEVEFGDPDDATDVLWLFRSRRETLERSAACCSRGRAHRVRLPNRPVWVEPWVGLVLGHVGSTSVGKAQVADAVDRARTEPGGSSVPDSEESWRILGSMGRNDRAEVDVGRIRTSIARARVDHPAVRREHGAMCGPVLGSIHASKGREAVRVLLSLDKKGRPDGEVEDEDEEARVAYVGATRAHRELHLMESSFRPFSRIERSDRVLSPARRSVRFEFGLAGDVDGVSAVAADVHPDAVSARIAQDWLASVSGPRRAPSPLFIVLERKGDRWINVIHASTHEGPVRLAGLSSSAVEDLFAAARTIPGGARLPPQVISDVFLLGVRTFAMAAEAAPAAGVHEPWASRGAWLVPVIHGFPRLAFH